ncbi:MAG TPA: response regulator [Desulfomonilaceae bacterium]|nr:response regulator [Desulfomonilaceae bacterium]
MKRHRILIVDDDRKNITLLRNMLEVLGHDAEPAFSGTEALKKLDSSIDLVLLDVMMPDMDGFHVAAAIRNETVFGDIPIIMVTILDSKHDRLRAVESGANDFISKPIDMLELRVRLASLLKMKDAQDRIKASLCEKDLLLREIHHRVKNNLAIVSSLLRLQSRYAADDFHQKMFMDADYLIQAMAVAHEKLYQAEDLRAVGMSEYVGSLVDHLVISSKTLGTRITLNKVVQDILLDLEIIIPLGIILTEVVLNSLQHGFPDRGEGEITISLQAVGESGFELTVRDNGIGLPHDFDYSTPKTFGMRLVNIFSRQLNGTVQITSAEGTEFRIFCDGGRR